MMPLRALVVEAGRDGVQLIRVLQADRDIEARASTGFAVILDEVASNRPDIVVMLPANQSQAVAAIEEVMALHPLPILVIGDNLMARDAVLRAGAVEMISLPEGATAEADLRVRVRHVSQVAVIRHIRGRSKAHAANGSLTVVGIAASTGGPQAVVAVLHGLTGLGAAVMVVQHLHPSFTGNFRDWMERESPLPVEVAGAGVSLQAGHVYLAPASLHMKLGPHRTIVLDPLPTSLHRPSADALFASLAAQAGAEAIGVLLTGMGEDGAAGLLEMRRAGARTIAQDETTSVVYGMPRAAERLGAAEQVLALELIAPAIMRAARVIA